MTKLAACLASVVVLAGAVGPAVSGTSVPAEPAGRTLADQSYRCTVTVADLRSIRIALLAWARDHGGTFPAAKTVAELKPELAPTYLQDLVTTDAWGTEFRYRVEDGGKGFTVASAGSDRSFDESTWSTPGLLASSKQDAALGAAATARREWIIQE